LQARCKIAEIPNANKFAEDLMILFHTTNTYIEAEGYSFKLEDHKYSPILRCLGCILANQNINQIIYQDGIEFLRYFIENTRYTSNLFRNAVDAFIEMKETSILPVLEEIFANTQPPPDQPPGGVYAGMAWGATRGAYAAFRNNIEKLQAML
jgi:hypothetical protein